MKAKLLSIFALVFFVSMNSWAQFYASPGGGSVSVSLDKNSLTLTVGEEATLTCDIVGGIGFSSWDIDNQYCVEFTGISEVTNTRTVTALNAGTATITVTCSGASATCTVTVNPLTVTAYEGASGEYWATYYNATRLNFTADENTTVFQAALNGNQLTMTPVANREIPTDKAVILKSTSSTITLTYPYMYSAETLEGNQLQGTATEITNPGNAYVLNKGTKGVGFYKLSLTGTIGANKAYLTYSYSGASAREYFLFEDETTGIEMPTAEITDSDAAVYDLQGRQVVNPAKGLYIVNGKKVFINK